MKKLAAAYIAERFVYTQNFSEPQNPRFIIESGFKSRAGYNGARTVDKIILKTNILRRPQQFQIITNVRV